MKLYRYIKILENAENEKRLKDRFKSSLKESKLYFSHPASFNDPLECTIPVKIQNYDSQGKEYIEVYEHYLDTRLGQLSDSNARRKWAQERIEFGLPIEKCLMTCFAERNNNQLMWAHYADQHQGVCLGYDFPDINEEFCKKVAWGTMAEFDMKKSRLSLLGKKVLYSNERPALHITNSNEDVAKWKFDDNYNLTDCIFNKPKCWSYEQEWRLALIYPTNINCMEKAFSPDVDTKGYYAILPHEWLREITFGLRLDNKFCEEIVDIARKSGYSKVEFRREKILQDRFEVESEPYPQ